MIQGPGQTIFARKALLQDGWAEDVSITISLDGTISQVSKNTAGFDHQADILLPSPANVHSHAFQRAMAGMSERRGSGDHDSFWTWREIMFRFLDILTPEDVQSIAAFVQMEMLEAGYAAVGEFHYLHHQPDGHPYDDIAEMSSRIAAAAQETGIGLTLLPVQYEFGGCDRRPLGPGQIRFGNDADRFGQLLEAAKASLGMLAQDSIVGAAPHSLRAVGRESLADTIALTGANPLHMHIAEQAAEVQEVKAAYGLRPVEWLFENHEVSQNWCLIHCTQMTESETLRLAASGAVAGLCPITESNLGDGIFDGVRYVNAGGRWGVGSDSNIRITLCEELRTLEYSQRLRDTCRAALAETGRSTGRFLFEEALIGGAQAVGRDAGSIAEGRYADLVALDGSCIDLEGREEDELLDAYIFAGDDRVIRDVWSFGRHVVQDGAHLKRDDIRSRYRKTIAKLRQRL